MLLSMGKHGNGRLLSRPSVETMTTDQLTPEQKAASGLISGYFDSHGWGFGASVVTRRDDAARPAGTVGLDRCLRTSTRSDHTQDRARVLKTQCARTSAMPPEA